MSKRKAGNDSPGIVVTIRNADAFATWLWMTYASSPTNEITWFRILEATPRRDGNYRVRLAVPADRYQAITRGLGDRDDIERVVHDVLHDVAHTFIERDLTAQQRLREGNAFGLKAFRV